jgi:hypothetical protein
VITVDETSPWREEDEPSDGESADVSFTGSRAELFDGDAGSLGIDERLCLIALLKNTFISSVEQPSHWYTLLEDEVLIKGRLNDLLLDLVIDHDREVAYKVQIRDADGVGSVPPLLKAATYTREETALMIFLRSRYTSDRAEGHEHVLVDRDEMHAYVENLRPEHATDIAGDNRRTTNAIATLSRAHILEGRQDGNTFRVSPVIEALLPVSELTALAAWFAAQNVGAGQPAGTDSDDGSPDHG